MNKKITHIQVAGEGKNLTLFPFYEITPTQNKRDERHKTMQTAPSGLSLDLRTGMALLAFENFLPTPSWNRTPKII